MKSAGKARNNGLYRHIRTSKEIIRNLLNDYMNKKHKHLHSEFVVRHRNFLHYPKRFSVQYQTESLKAFLASKFANRQMTSLLS